MFYGWGEAINFGIRGLVYILIYYIIASIIFNRKNNRVLVSGILIIIYIYTLMLYSLGTVSDLWEYPGLYEVGLGLLNGLLYIPFLIICFIVDLISFIIWKIHHKNDNLGKIENEKEIETKESSSIIETETINEEKDLVKINCKDKVKKKRFNKSVIVTLLVILSVAFQFILMAVLEWWGTSGRYESIVNKAIQYEIQGDYKTEIEILNEEKYSDKIRKRIKYLYENELEKLYNTGKYEECIELTNLLEENFGYDYDDDFYHSIKMGWANFRGHSYAKLYNRALENNDAEEMIKLKRDMLKIDTESSLNHFYDISFENLTKYDYLKYAEVGDIVTLGKYYIRAFYETKNKEEISWVVYKVDNSKVYLGANCGLESYNLKENDKYYNESELKRYLNDELLFELFNEGELELLEKDDNNDYMSIPDTEDVLLIEEKLNKKLSHLKSEYVTSLYSLRNVIIKNNAFSKELGIENYDGITKSIDEQYKDTKEILERNVLVLPTIIVNKEKIDDYIIKDKKIKSEKVSQIKSKLRKDILDKKIVSEYDGKEKVDNFDTILFGKKSGKYFYQEGIAVPYGTEDVEEYAANERKKRIIKSKEYRINTLSNDEYYEWIILEKQDDKALILSKDVIEFGKYQDYDVDSKYEKSKVSWENSEIRRYYNEVFLINYFDEYEREVIIDIDLPVSKNPRFGTYYGETTRDKIFSLSVEECLKYFTNDLYQLNDDSIEIQKLEATWDEEAKKYYLDLLYEFERKQEESKNARFWLRDLGEQFYNVCFIDYNGAINTRGQYVSNSKIGYRPAMWISLK